MCPSASKATLLSQIGHRWFPRHMDGENFTLLMFMEVQGKKREN